MSGIEGILTPEARRCMDCGTPASVKDDKGQTLIITPAKAGAPVSSSREIEEQLGTAPVVTMHRGSAFRVAPESAPRPAIN